MLKYIKIGGRKLGLICAVQKQQEGISVLSFVQKTLFLSLSRVFSPHDLNGSRIKKANLKFFISCCCCCCCCCYFQRWMYLDMINFFEVSTYTMTLITILPPTGGIENTTQWATGVIALLLAYVAFLAQLQL